MANVYGLVTDTKKYGSGSFYAPFNTSRSKALRIDPVANADFGMAAGEDFYISVWIKYGTVNVSSLNTSYPIIKYGSQTNFFSGWELGLRISRIGDGNSALPYFSFVKDDTTGTATRITTTFNGSNGNLLQPTSGFDHWEVIRTNGVITFRFNGVNSSNTSTTYNGRIGATVNILATSNNDPAYKGIYVGSQQPFVVNQDNGAYIDQLFFARGVNAVQSTNIDGSINDGKLTTTQFLYNFNGNYLDTTGATQTASTTITSTSTIVTIAREISRPVIALQPRFSLAVTAFVAPRIRTFSASLSSTFTQTAAGIIPVYGQGAFTSRFAISARPNYYPRPWQTWNTSTDVPMYPSYANWQDIYIDNIEFPSSQGQQVLFDFGGQQISSYGFYNGSNTNYYIGVNDNWQPISSPGSFDLRITRGGSAQAIFSGATYSLGTWDFNPTVSASYGGSITAASFRLLTQHTLPGTTPASSPTVVKTVGNFYGSYQGSVTTPAHRLQLSTWRARANIDLGVTAGTWLYSWVMIRAHANPITVQISNGTYAYTQDSVFNINVVKDGGLRIQIYDITAGRVVADYSETLYQTTNPSTGQTATWAGTTGLLQVASRSSAGNYITFPDTGSNALFTKTGFDYASTVIDTDPYLVQSQDKILGLYNTTGAVDSIGLIASTQAQLVSSFTARTTANKAIRLTASVTSRFTQTANLVRIQRSTTALQSRFTQASTVTRVLLGVVPLTSTSQATAQVKQFKGTSLAAQFRFTATTNAIKTSRARSNLTAFVVQVTIDIGTKVGRATLTSRFAVTANNTRLRDNQVSATSTITQATTAKKIVRSPVAITSQVTTAINGQRVRYMSADLQVQAFELSTNRKDAQAQANLNARFALDANVYILQYSLTNVVSTFTAEINPVLTRQFRSAIISPSQLTVNGGYVRGATANLQVQAFELATGSRFTLEPRLQKIVEQETRIYLVKPEDRRLEIYSDGIYKIKPETRLLPVKASDPVNTIPGIKL